MIKYLFNTGIDNNWIIEHWGQTGIYKINSEVTDINPTLSIITLKVNGLETQNKNQSFKKWIKITWPTLYCLLEKYFRFKDKYRLTVKERKKTHHANGNQKRAEVVKLISDKIDFKTKNYY